MLYRIALGTTSKNIELGKGGNEAASGWTLQFVGTVGTGTVAVKGYVCGLPVTTPIPDGNKSVGTALSSTDRVALAYTVGSTGTVTAGSTTISALGIYTVRTDGLSLCLDYTAGGGSDWSVIATPIFGGG